MHIGFLPETEIRTKRGWIPVTEVTTATRLATLWLSDLSMHHTKAKQVFSHKAKCLVVSYQTSIVNFSLPIRQPTIGVIGRENRYELVPACNLMDRSMKLPMSGYPRIAIAKLLRVPHKEVELSRRLVDLTVIASPRNASMVRFDKSEGFWCGAAQKVDDLDQRSIIGCVISQVGEISTE
jgi:hypothetical protein